MRRFDSPLMAKQCIPHSCSCVIESYIEETERVDEMVVWTGGDGAVPTPEGLKKKRSTMRTRRYGRDGSLEREYDDDAKSPGTRLRGVVVAPCLGHVGFDGVLQTQRVRVTDVCRCVFQELWEGEHHKEKYYGAVFETLCHEHARQVENHETSIKDLRDVIIARAQELNRERELE